MLASLAEEHDQSASIEDYNTDEASERLFTGIKPFNYKLPVKKGSGSEDGLSRERSLGFSVQSHLNYNTPSKDTHPLGASNEHATGDKGMQSKDSDVAHVDLDNAIEEFDSDDPDSLISGTNTAAALASRQSCSMEPAGIMKKRAGNIAESNEVKVLDGSSEQINEYPDSDDSASIISPCVNHKSLEKLNNIHTQTHCLKRNCPPGKVRYSENSEEFTLLKSRARPLRPLRSRSETSVKQTRTTVNSYITLQPDISVGDNCRTPASIRTIGADESIQTNPNNSSPVTPFHPNRLISPHISNVSNSFTTSSPFADSSSTALQFHISTGLSPVGPGYVETWQSGDKSKTVNALASESPFNESGLKEQQNKFRAGKSRLSVSSPQSPGITLEELKEFSNPKSNESVQSQWSEIDESDYIRQTDESAIAATQQKLAQGIGILTHSSTPVIAGCKVMGRRQSAGAHSMSQWSEADEDQLMTLDLDDITNMSGRLNRSNDVHNVTQSNRSHRESNRTQSNRSHRESYRTQSNGSHRESNRTQSNRSHRESDRTQSNRSHREINRTNLQSPHNSDSISSDDSVLDDTTGTDLLKLSPRKRPYSSDGYSCSAVSPLKSSFSKLDFT